MTDTLFSSSAPKPLAERLRPASLSEVVGQDHLLGPDGPIGRMVAAGRLSSMILWGPPGVGKTTIALLLAKAVGLEFSRLSGIKSGVADLRKEIEAAEARRATGRGTVLFLDECHAWKNNQQDSLLPYVEDGTVILIGATTENPSFELNAALLSRAQVFPLKRIDEIAGELLLRRAEQTVGKTLPLTKEARSILVEMADGDGRHLVTLCEELFSMPGGALDGEGLQKTLQRRAAVHDKSGDGHYNLLSALQKSIRGSDVQAALYWLARMLRAGEQPKTIFRRLAVMATEEIGLADPAAIRHVEACASAFDRVGVPEGLPALANCVAYLATAVKSNAVYKAFYDAMELAGRTGSLPPPKHIINAPTAMMRDMGFKDGYRYDHDFPYAFSGQEFMPAGLDGERRPALYVPNERGNEREVKKRMDFWEGLRRDAR
ncbi:replication-associated recombination protein A [Telmatospirillum siberiense]|uniref:Replication-associated recombination protein A n=1 Tax=Telmatospirillum siberiense TaxID=382514 RepID=A0A2N3PS63_9PROT|nr:replication-associated recombination protein A [Telmatospirillum siberiense]PKU23249.1 AAA family ATPase [Telmatospirillum siberiense]